jgi:RNA polymerase sigma factor (sigma-70 family)
MYRTPFLAPKAKGLTFSAFCPPNTQTPTVGDKRARERSVPPFDLQRLQDHNEQEWEAFFRFYEERLFHFAQRFSSAIGDETARDLVQETLLAAYEELCSKGTRLQEGGRYLSTWLFGICKNRCRDYVKTTDLHARKEEELLNDPTLPLPLGSGPTGHTAPEITGGMADCLACLPDPQTKDLALDCFALLPSDTIADLVGCLNRASPPLRAALILRYVVGLKYREVAELLGISLEAVKGRIYDAIPVFRDRLTRVDAVPGTG